MGRWLRCGIVAALAGGIAVLSGIFAETHDKWIGMTIVIVGAAVVICGLGAVFVAITMHCYRRSVRPVEDAYDEGHDLGYSKGWRDCARTNVRPVSKINESRPAPSESVQPAHAAKSRGDHPRLDGS